MKRLVSVSLILASMVVLLSSCNCYNKMLKKISKVETSCTPNVLSLKGSAVTADVKVTFPAKYFDEIAVLKITPVLVFEGGEIAATPKFVQGEKVKDNYTVISWKKGGSYTQTVSFPFDPRASLATLELRIESKCANKCAKKYKDFFPLAAIPVAQGVSTVQNDACAVSALQMMADNFKRVTTVSKDADILYLINSAKVRSAQLSKEQVKMFEDFVKEYSNKDRVTLGNVYAKGYASPDGPVKFNDKLSKERSATGKAAVSKQLKDVNVKYDEAAYGEDWDGFKKLVEASNIEDKDLILQVLQMYSSPVQRDQEIQNMSQVFNVLKESVLPQLRRTQVIASADIEGLTDQELKAAVVSNLDNLNVEEMLYAATLVSDKDLQAKIYKAAATKFNDARAYNNLGVVLAQQSKLADAKAAFEKASAIQSAPQITNNLGVIALAQGNLADAKKYISSLSASDAKEAKGLVDLAEGNYTDAVKGLSGYNLAVAQVCNGNLSAAKSALSGVNTAKAEYLKAVIAMREGDTTSASALLKSAIAKDSSLKAKAQKDVEFAKLFGTSEFLAL